MGKVNRSEWASIARRLTEKTATAVDLAEEYSCTTAYIYMIRSAIRKQANAPEGSEVTKATSTDRHSGQDERSDHQRENLDTDTATPQEEAEDAQEAPTSARGEEDNLPNPGGEAPKANSTTPTSEQPADADTAAASQAAQAWDLFSPDLSSPGVPTPEAFSVHRDSEPPSTSDRNPSLAEQATSTTPTNHQEADKQAPEPNQTRSPKPAASAGRPSSPKTPAVAEVRAVPKTGSTKRGAKGRSETQDTGRALTIEVDGEEQTISFPSSRALISDLPRILKPLMDQMERTGEPLTFRIEAAEFTQEE